MTKQKLMLLVLVACALSFTACVPTDGIDAKNSTWTFYENMTYVAERSVCKQSVQENGMIVFECMHDSSGSTAEEKWEHNRQMGWGPQPPKPIQKQPESQFFPEFNSTNFTGKRWNVTYYNATVVTSNEAES